MESQYIDLVLCKHHNNDRYFLFQAPEFSGLQNGDQVIVETRKGEKEAIVIDKTTVNTTSDNDFIEFAMTVCNATHPLKKVLKKVVYIELKYGDENEKTGSDSKA